MISDKISFLFCSIPPKTSACKSPPGLIERQQRQVAELAREESRLLPKEIDYLSITGLRVEARQKLDEIRPLSIGQAGRISGVSPSDIAVLLIWLSQHEKGE